MPKAPSTRHTKRPGPYNLRAPGPAQTSASMATTLTSPVTPWTPHHPHMWSDPHMGYHQPQQHQQLLHDYVPLSAPAPPPPVSAAVNSNQSNLWSPEEDDMLMNAKAAGVGWNDIHHQYFPTKSGNACRKRHERLMIKLRTHDWDDARIAQVMSEYNKPNVRELFWGRIAAPFGERWEDVERVCFQQGLKALRASQTSHNRGCSRGSSGGQGAPSPYEHTSSHGEYEKTYDHDDSGIDLHAPGHSRRSSQVVQQNALPLDQILHQRTSSYTYS